MQHAPPRAQSRPRHSVPACPSIGLIRTIEGATGAIGRTADQRQTEVDADRRTLVEARTRLGVWDPDHYTRRSSGDWMPRAPGAHRAGRGGDGLPRRARARPLHGQPVNGRTSTWVITGSNRTISVAAGSAAW